MTRFVMNRTYRWRMRMLVVGLLIALVGAAAPGALAETRAEAFGDSVMLGAVGPLKNRDIRVDAAVSRQATAGPALLRKSKSKLPRNVFLHFGTNGTYPLKTCTAMIDALGPQRRVFLITVKVPRPWERTNNRMLRRCAAAYPPDRVHIVDWNWAASRRPHWLYADGYHLRPTGAKNFARILVEALERADRRVDLVTTRRLSSN
jgi:hypothetical protein